MLDIENHNRLYELSSKPVSYKYSTSEIDFILKHSNIKKCVAKYFIWKQKRHNGLYVGFMIDQMPNRVRKTAVDNSTDVICERKLCKIELLELAQNYGRNSRIVTIYNYDSVESLIPEDLKYNIDTPEEFRKACRIRGFSDSKLKFTEQLKLELI